MLVIPHWASIYRLSGVNQAFWVDYMLRLNHHYNFSFCTIYGNVQLFYPRDYIQFNLCFLIAIKNHNDLLTYRTCASFLLLKLLGCQNFLFLNNNFNAFSLFRKNKHNFSKFILMLVDVQFQRKFRLNWLITFLNWLIFIFFN